MQKVERLKTLKKWSRKEMYANEYKLATSVCGHE